MTSLDDLYTSYTSEYSQGSKSQQTILTRKNYIGRLIAKLFPNVCQIRNAQSSYTVAYKGLSLNRPPTDSTVQEDPLTLTIPPYCELDKQFLPDFKLHIPLPHLVNGHNLKVELTIAKDLLEIHIGNKKINLSDIGVDEHFSDLNQKKLDGVLKMVQLLRVCKGCPWNRERNTPATCCVEEWSALLESSSDAGAYRIRANCCKQVLPFVGNYGETCGQCRTTILRARRTQEQSDQSCNPAQVARSHTTSELLHEDDQQNHHFFSCHKTVKDNLPLHKDSGDHDETTNNMEIDVNMNEDIELCEQDNKDMLDILQKELPSATGEFAKLMRSQLRNLQVKNKGSRRWNPAVISICLSLYSRSPQAYADLKSSGMLVLPSQQLLRYYKNAVKQQPDFQYDNLNWMLKEADRQKIPSEGRHGGLVLDEMQIQDDLQVF